MKKHKQTTEKRLRSPTQCQKEAQNVGAQSDKRDANPAFLPPFALSRLSSARFSAACKMIGWGMILFGMALFVVAVSLFTYQGPPLPSFVNTIGELSFVFWLVPIIIGVIFLFF